MSTSFETAHNYDQRQAIQTRIRESNMRILESTQNMEGIISESEVIANNTAQALVEQGEQLRNIRHRCNQIDTNLVHVQKNLNKLGSVFGGIKNYLRPPKGSLRKSASQPQLNISDKKPMTTKNPAHRVTNLKHDNDTYLGKSLGDMDDVEIQIEERLRNIHLGVRRLHEVGLNMNKEIETQNPLIDGINDDLDKLNRNVRKKNVQIRRDHLS